MAFRIKIIGDNLMPDKYAQFLPFHAINQFMRDDYRLNVIKSVLSALPSLPEEYRAPINRLTKKTVRVPGFRNSTKAPVSVRIKPTADAFEKSPQLVVAILSAWAAMFPELRQMVYDLLISRSWEILPVEADRAKLPVFIPTWPKGEDFDTLNKAFVDAYPNTQAENDDVSLMVVWLSVRLPYKVEDEKDEIDQSNIEEQVS
jgi:hypothetical protein